jgi:hypothetical protein
MACHDVHELCPYLSSEYLIGYGGVDCEARPVGAMSGLLAAHDC